MKLHYYIQSVVAKKLLFSAPKNRVDNLILDMALSLDESDISCENIQEEYINWEIRKNGVLNSISDTKAEIQKTEEEILLGGKTAGASRLLDLLIARRKSLEDQYEEHLLAEPRKSNPIRAYRNLNAERNENKQYPLAAKLFVSILIGKVKDVFLCPTLPKNVLKILEKCSPDDLFVIGKMENGKHCLRLENSLSLVQWEPIKKV